MKPILLLTLSALFASVCAAQEAFLADRHVQRGVKCETCHKTQPPKDVPMQTCQSCHGDYAALAKRTNKKDINPHASHVEDIQCNACHRGHKKPAFVCDECHQFKDIKVP